jgi:hypothetical protein
VRWALPILTVCATLAACGGIVDPGDQADGGRGTGKSGGTPDSSDSGLAVVDSGSTSDSGSTESDGAAPDIDADSIPDASSAVPAECADPGPFAIPTSIATQVVGTWLYCDSSIFVGAGVTTTEVGIDIRADSTWQKVGASGGKLVPLTGHTNVGTWSTYALNNPLGAMVMFSWDTTGLDANSGLDANPVFAADGRSMQVTTPAGGHQSISAKATGTP